MKKLTLLISSLAIAAAMQAQIIHVPEDFQTIQAAVDAAAYGDTVLVAPGTYLENVRIQGNDKTITLASNFIFSNDTNDINNTIIDASQPQDPNYSMGILLKNQDSILSPKIIGFTVTGGTGYYKTYGGGIYSNLAVPILEYNHIKDCSITGMQPNGAGIYIGNFHGDTSKICQITHNVIKNCTITPATNTIEEIGAGLAITGASALIEDNRIINNIITGNSNANGAGAGIYFGMWTNFFHPKVIIRNNEITNNEIESWDASGGGICLNDELGMTEFTVEGNLISNNECRSIGASGDAKGGGIYLYNPDPGSVISANDISNNSAIVGPPGSQPYGGGIYLEGVYPEPPKSNLLIEKNRIVGNIALYGGGIISVTTGIDLVNNFISGNQATFYGGAVYFNGSSDTSTVARFINNTIIQNSLTGQGGQGGSIIFSGAMKVLLMNNIFYGNQAENSNELFISNNTIVQINNCDLDISEINGNWTGSNNFYADPEFIDDMKWDCANPGPCWDSGRDTITAFGMFFHAPDSCIDNNPRPMDQAVDLGACEVKLCTAIPSVQSSEFKVQSYPNPTGGASHFSFRNSQYQWITLNVYDVQGRQVAEVLNERIPAGDHIISYDLSVLPSGIYYYRLMTDDCRLTTGKLIKY